jgi:hypothetical protein
MSRESSHEETPHSCVAPYCDSTAGNFIATTQQPSCHHTIRNLTATAQDLSTQERRPTGATVYSYAIRKRLSLHAEASSQHENRLRANHQSQSWHLCTPAATPHVIHTTHAWHELKLGVKQEHKGIMERPLARTTDRD